MKRREVHQILRNGTIEAKREDTRRHRGTTEDKKKSKGSVAFLRNTPIFHTTDVTFNRRTAPRYGLEEESSKARGRAPSHQTPPDTVYSPLSERRRRLAENLVSPRAEGGFLGGRDVDSEARKPTASPERERDRTEDVATVRIGSDSRRRNIAAPTVSRTIRFFDDDADINDDDDSYISRYNSEKGTKPSIGRGGDAHRQPSYQPFAADDSLFQETIYSPSKDRYLLAENLISPRAEGGFLGGRDDGDARRSARRERRSSRGDSKADYNSSLPPAGDSGELLVTTTTTSCKIPGIEIDEVTGQLGALRNNPEDATDWLNGVRREMNRAEREHANEVESLKTKLRELRTDKVDLMNELDSLRLRNELLRVENEGLRSEMEKLKEASERDKYLHKTSSNWRV